ncbi:MAG: hypothetical protein FJX92_08885 [Bacteroidetes bacterium]|nr:hypothetical protein [Bacteroidota bacterium]
MSNTGSYLHFCQRKEFGVWKLFIKVEGWKIPKLLKWSNPVSLIKFSSVAGYDHNSSYFEHNNWEGKLPLREPLGLAADIYRWRARPREIRRRLSATHIDLYRVSYEDSDGCFFALQEHSNELIAQIDVPTNRMHLFTMRVCSTLPALSQFLGEENRLNTWYVIQQGEIVATYAVKGPIVYFLSDQLPLILKSIETSTRFIHF